MSDIKSNQYLLAQIERKDRRFRFAQGVFMGLLGVGIILILLIQFRAIDEFRSQSAERAKGLKALSTQNKDLLIDNKHLNEQTNRYIQCVSRFFATTDRTNLVLTDLDKCSFTQNGQPVPGVDVGPTSVDGDKGTSAPGSATTNAPADAEASASSNKAPSATPEPTKVLGIPVCLPFTQLCVRQ